MIKGKKTKKKKEEEAIRGKALSHNTRAVFVVVF